MWRHSCVSLDETQGVVGSALFYWARRGCDPFCGGGASSSAQWHLLKYNDAQLQRTNILEAFYDRPSPSIFARVPISILKHSLQLGYYVDRCWMLQKKMCSIPPLR